MKLCYLGNNSINIKTLKNLINQEISFVSFTHDNVWNLNTVLLENDIVVVEGNYFNEVFIYVSNENFKNQKKNNVLVLSKAPDKIDIEYLNLLFAQILSKEKKINLPVKNGIIELDINDILYFENINRKIFVKTDNHVIETSLTLKTLKEINLLNFFSPYVSFNINLNKVVKLHNNTLVLCNGDEIHISQKRQKKTKKIVRDYFKQKVTKKD